MSRCGEWISVKERLPEVVLAGMSSVLISDGRTVTIGEFYLKSIDGWTEERTYAWRAPLSCCSERELWESITHWSPLPEPPENNPTYESARAILESLEEL